MDSVLFCTELLWFTPLTPYVYWKSVRRKRKGYDPAGHFNEIQPLYSFTFDILMIPQYHDSRFPISFDQKEQPELGRRKSDATRVHQCQLL